MLRYLVEDRCPSAERNYPVHENLSTHTAKSLYETFLPERARNILDRLEFHPTPKHGSAPKQAEIAISLFERGRLPCRVLDAIIPTATGADPDRRAQRAPGHYRLAVHCAKPALHPNGSTRQSHPYGIERSFRQSIELVVACHPF